VRKKKHLPHYKGVKPPYNPQKTKEKDKNIDTPAFTGGDFPLD